MILKIYQGLAMLVLAFGAYTDFKERMVHEFPYLIMFFLGIFIGLSPVASLLFLLLFSFVPVSLPGFGKGDSMAVAMIFTAAGFSLIQILFFALLLSIIYHIISKKKSIPLVTMLFFSYGICFFHYIICIF